MILVSKSRVSSQSQDPLRPRLWSRLGLIDKCLGLRIDGLGLVISLGPLSLGHIPVVTINKPALSLYRPDALPVAQPTVLKHWREKNIIEWTKTIIIQFCRCWTVTEGVNYWTKTASDGLTRQFAAEVRKLQQMFKVDVVMMDNKAAVWHCRCRWHVVTSIWVTTLMTCLYLLVVLPRHVARTTQQHLQPLKLGRHLSCR